MTHPATLEPHPARSHRTALLWAAVGLAVHLAVSVGALSRNGWNPQWFVHFGDDYQGYPVAHHVFGDSHLAVRGTGHDGQAFWLLARDPLLLGDDWEPNRHLDRPAYRAQRVAYPLCAAPWFQLGGERALLWGLLATNLVAVFLGGYAAALLAAEFGRARAGLAFALNPGVVAATLLDVADGFSLAALLWCLLLVRWNRIGWAVAAAALAVLAKESAWLSLAGVALLAPGLPRRNRLALAVVPAAFAGLWGVYVRVQLGWPPAGVREFALPFGGYLDAYRLVWRPGDNWSYAVIAGLVVAAAAVAVWRWWRSPNLLLSATVPVACIVPLFSVNVLNLALNPLRVAAPLVTLLLIDVLARPAPRAADPPAVG